MTLTIDNGVHFTLVIVTMSRSAYFMASSLGNEEFQRLMSDIGTYLKGLPGRLDVYYCEKGTFVLPVYEDSGWSVKGLKKSIADRFNQDWTLNGAPDGKVRIPVRITEAHVPGDINSIETLFRITDFPFDADTDQAVEVNASMILECERQGVLRPITQTRNEEEEENSSNSESEIPKELSLMLDYFTEHIEELTSREAMVLLYYLNGYEISQLPELMGISINTVRKHNRNVYHKMGVNSKEELMMYLDVLERCNRLEEVEDELESIAEKSASAVS